MSQLNNMLAQAKYDMEQHDSISRIDEIKNALHRASDLIQSLSNLRNDIIPIDSVCAAPPSLKTERSSTKFMETYDAALKLFRDIDSAYGHIEVIRSNLTN